MRRNSLPLLAVLFVASSLLPQACKLPFAAATPASIDSSTAVVIPVAPAAPGTTLSTGVNLATACVSYAGHWGYPAEKANIDWDLKYYKAKGFTLFRVMVEWESLQNQLYGPLTAWQVGCLHDLLDLARQNSVKVLLDLHNYARYTVANDGGKDDVAGATPSTLGIDLPTAALTDVWTRIATEFNGDSALWGYGLMNEPHDLPTASTWPDAAQATVTAIRRIDRTTTVVVMRDVNWSSAPWPAGSPELNIVDPSQNVVYEQHVYFDRWSSGTYTETYDAQGAYPDIGVDRAKPFVEWLKQHNFRGLYGEFGAPGNDPRWLEVVDRFLKYVTDNGVNATAWGGGYLWSEWGQETQWFNLDPLNANQMPSGLVEKPMIPVLAKYPSRPQ